MIIVLLYLLTYIYNLGILFNLIIFYFLHRTILQHTNRWNAHECSGFDLKKKYIYIFHIITHFTIHSYHHQKKKNYNRQKKHIFNLKYKLKPQKYSKLNAIDLNINIFIVISHFYIFFIPISRILFYCITTTLHLKKFLY